MTEDIFFENEDRMTEREILLLIAKYLDIINNKLEWVCNELKGINTKLKNP